MLLDTVIAKAFYRLFTLIFSVYVSFSGAAVMPSKDEPVKPSSDGAKLTFAAIADPQISDYRYSRYKYFLSAADDLRNAEGLDALIMAGDIAENGLSDEYQLVYDELNGLDLRYIACVGNHDIRLRNYKSTVKRFNSFVNALNGDETADGLWHSETVKGYKFIVLGSDKTEFEESYISDKQLQWLDSEIASQNGKPVFVMIHQPLKLTHGLPDVWNSPIDSAGSVGECSEKLEAVLNGHDNVIFITGHEHTGFGEFTYEKIGNFHSVNLPSLCCNNDCGEYNGHGLGCIVEVYEDSVIFRARDMCKGLWLPQYDVSIPVV